MLLYCTQSSSRLSAGCISWMGLRVLPEIYDTILLLRYKRHIVSVFKWEYQHATSLVRRIY